MRIVSLVLLLTACTGDASRALFPTGSSTLSTSSDLERLYALDPDAGALVVIEPGHGAVDRVELGGTPARVVRARDRVFVSLRDQGTVVVFDESGTGLVERARVPVGPEPFGLVTTHEGSTVYAAVAMADEIVAIDVDSAEIVNRYAVGVQPRWLAIHPSGGTVYATSNVGGVWWSIATDSGQVRTFALPRNERLDDSQARPLPPHARFTGDPTVAPNGSQIAMPVLYVSPEQNPAAAAAASIPYYTNAGADPVGRTTPTVALFKLDRRGTPESTPDTLIPVLALENATATTGPGSRRSYLSSATFSPDGLTALVTMESSRAVVVVPTHVDVPSHLAQAGRLPERGDGFQTRRLETYRTDFGPRGVTFLSRDLASVDQWLDHSVANVNYDDARRQLRRHAAGDTSLITSQAMPSNWMARTDRVEVGPVTLDPTIEFGRRLFFDALDTRVTANGGGTSCSTCHFEGGSDGITWILPDADLQTPSLAGKVSLTEPVTWLSSVPSVTDEILLTTFDRMGGRGLEPDVAAVIAAFVDTTPYPSPAPVDPAAAERGRVIFEGSAECATCHFGPALTDNLEHTMFDLTNVRTPTLRGIAATPPYIHDGRAQTLTELVEMSERGGMGRTDHLSAADKADLVAYLRSL